MDKQEQKIREALAKCGIYTEDHLDEAIKEIKPLNIGCVVSPPPSTDVMAE